MEIEQWLDNNKFSIDIWKGKYQRNNENFEEWLNRISNNNEKIKDMVRNKRFIFGGRILANRGMEKEGKHLTFSNCYVMTPPEDNLESIFETASRLARTYSYSGGCGIDISNLRPKDALVNNAAVKSTGAVSFMDMYSKVTETIGQNGRRAALMISISCDHPDLEDFIEIKKDLTKVNFANVSVRFTDKFLNSVLNDEDYELHFTYKSSLGEKELRKNIKARKVFEKFVAANWSSAEPGALFWDKIKGWNLLTNTKTFSYAGTNPSLRKGTKVLTTEGIIEIEKLENKEFQVYTLNNNIANAKCFLSGHNKQLYKLTLENGKEIYCTPEHKWAVYDKNTGEYIKTLTTDLKIGDYFPVTVNEKLSNGMLGSYDDGFFIGFWYADGSVTLRKDGRYQYGFTFGNEKVNEIRKIIVDKLNSIIKSINNCRVRKRNNKEWYEISSSNCLLHEYMKKFGVDDKHILPQYLYKECSEDFRRGFIDGLFSGDGCVDIKSKNPMICINSCSKEFMYQLSDLLWWYGIKNNVNSITSVMSLGNRNAKEYHISELKIGFVQSKRFAKLFKLTNKEKQNKIDKICSMNVVRKNSPIYENIKLKNVELTDLYEDVWDITVFDETHTFRLNHCITGNCAEEPLPAGGSCLLGSINLSAYVVNGEFDIDLYKEDIGNAVRALNEVLEEGLPLHPLKEQRDSVGKWKQIGLGIFGLADMLILKGIKYGSRESIEFCDKLGHILINEACRASALLAKEKGSFEEFNPQEVLNTDFAKYNLDDDVVDLVYNYGLRNSQLLTTAPTGSISNMLHISGGIEPIYDYVYTRTTKSLHEEGDVDYNIYTPIVKNYMEKNGLKNENELPFFFTNALKLDYKERLNMQSVWQSHIDGAISSTLNIPNETTKEQVFDIYIEAWRKGLKGVTIFRDGCDRIPILNNKKLERGVLVKDNNIVGLKRTLKTGCGNLHCSAFFNKETGAFVELFLGKGAKGGCLSTLNGLARMISLSARAGVKLDDIVGQLKSANACPSYAIRSAVNKDTSLGSCCPSAIGNALIDMSEEMKTMLKNGKNNIDKKETELKNIGCKIVVCENCGKPIKHKGGCIECENCGWSKCD